MTTKEVSEQLRSIADRLRTLRNDPAAMMDFQILISRLTPAQRRDLATVLQQMIAGIS